MINPTDIIKQIEQLYFLKPDSLVKYGRKKTIAEARAVCMYQLRIICGLSYPEIGDLLNRDHSTIIHNCKKVVKMIKNGTNSRVCATIKLTECNENGRQLCLF